MEKLLSQLFKVESFKRALIILVLGLGFVGVFGAYKYVDNWDPVYHNTEEALDLDFGPKVFSRAKEEIDRIVMESDIIEKISVHIYVPLDKIRKQGVVTLYAKGVDESFNDIRNDALYREYRQLYDVPFITINLKKDTWYKVEKGDRTYLDFIRGPDDHEIFVIGMYDRRTDVLVGYIVVTMRDGIVYSKETHSNERDRVFGQVKKIESLLFN